METTTITVLKSDKDIFVNMLDNLNERNRVKGKIPKKQFKGISQTEMFHIVLVIAKAQRSQ